MNYWDDRSNRYLTWMEGISPELIKRNLWYTPVLKLLLARKLREIGPNTLLEVGCGPGRLFSLYRGFQCVCMDYSSGMLARAADVCEQNGYDNITLMKGDVCDLVLGRCFDIVISSNVLLHIPPGKVEKAVEGICRHGREVLCVEWVDSCGVDMGNCHLHDYPCLFEDRGFELVDQRKFPLENQMLFHFRKRD